MKVEKMKVVGLEDAIRGMRNPKNSWDISDSYFVPNVIPFTPEFESKLKTYPPKLFTNNDCISYIVESSNECIKYNPWTQEYFISKKTDEKYPLEDNVIIKTDNVGIIGKADIDLMQRLVSYDDVIVNGGEPNSKYLRDIVVYVDITGSFDFWKEFDTYKVGTVSNSCSTMHTITKHPITLDNFSLYDLRDKDIEMIKRNIDYYNNEVLNDDSLSDTEKTRIMSKLNLLGFEQKRTIELNYQTIKNMNIWRCGHKLKEWRVLINAYFKHLPYVETLFLRNPYLKSNKSKEN